METGKWAVFRHSGRDGTDWRSLYEGSEEKARTRYSKVVESLRQGRRPTPLT